MNPTESRAAFRYQDAFARNIGWLTDWEQSLLRRKRVAIAGLGGVGGQHLLTLARLGVGRFHIADMDVFELPNFNRQAGASLSSIDRAKTEVMAEMALDINPELDIKIFDQGIDRENYDDFLDGVDLFVDGFDFFVLDMRKLIFARCAERGIPSITAAPVGMGVAYLSFLPGSMSFAEYFQLDGRPLQQQYINFIIGLTPKSPHRRYIADPKNFDLVNQRLPSTGLSCQLCSGVVGAEAVKILLGRGKVRAAPHYHIFDAYLDRHKVGYLPWGNRNPIQKVKRWAVTRMMTRLIEENQKMQAGQPISEDNRPADTTGSSELMQILERARWAPSGDNSQPWRFEIIGEDELLVHLTDEGGSNVYEYNDAQPTLLSAGCLIETLAIAASVFGRVCQWSYRKTSGAGHQISVKLPKQADVAVSNLADFIESRSVDRRRYRPTPLDDRQRQALSDSLGEGVSVRWYTSRAEKLRMAGVNAAATDIRLSIPEAYRVHQKMLDWTQDYSPTGIPANAVGLDKMTLKLMRWVTADWRRVRFMNRYLGGTMTPRLQLDLAPGLHCAAHFTLNSRRPIEVANGDRSNADAVALIDLGRRVQRFWLTATQMGLALQPSLAPLCYGFYGAHDTPFTEDEKARRKARALDKKLSQLDTGYRAGTLFFAGRIGVPMVRSGQSRSTRLSLNDLLDKTDTGETDPALSQTVADRRKKADSSV